MRPVRPALILLSSESERYRLKRASASRKTRSIIESGADSGASSDTTVPIVSKT
jgi:hypothetical protein